MDKLQICVIWMANTLAPSFKNLPDMFSIPIALLMLHAFRGFETVFDLTVWKLSLL